MSASLSFQKMHGLGNDFVMLAGAPSVEDISALVKQICDRHRGIGADGVIYPAPPSDPSRFDTCFVYWNQDGTQAEMCGNGIRCFARYLADNQCLPPEALRRPLRVETPAGLITPTLLPDGRIAVGMGAPILDPALIPFDTTYASSLPAQPGVYHLVVLGQTVSVCPVSMGNPHAVIFMEASAPLDPVIFGPAIESHPAFPAKVNVEFVTVHQPDHVTVTVWERGCGFTQACGTGACAVGVAGRLTDHLSETLTVTLPGGDLLIAWPGQPDAPVMMTGPAVLSFEGVYHL